MTLWHPFKSAAARETYLARYAERSASWPVPSTERLVPTAFGGTFVRESGPPTAPPLVMLPGIGSPGYTFAHNAARLSERHRLFVVDNIHDVGRSVSTAEVRNAADFCTWLDSLLNALELGTVDLLGLSYGGWIAARYALHAPLRVGKLVLLAPAGTIAPLPAGFIARALLTLVPGRRFLRGFVDWAAPGLASQPELAPLRTAMIEDAAIAQKCFASRRMVPPEPLSDADWTELTTPTLFLVGDREVMFEPLRAVQKLSRVAPQVQVKLLPGVGHDFFVVAAEEVDRRVIDHLARG